MLTQKQIAEKAYSLIDKNFYESFFFHPGGPIGVEGNGFLVMGCLFGLIMIISLYFNRNNGYTPGHHSRANGAYYAAVILVLAPYFIFRPSPESLEKTEISLATKMNKKIAELEIINIAAETNNVEKLKLIENSVDSSGKVNYILGGFDKFKYDSFLNEEKPETHYYLDDHNYQSEYVTLLKKVENEYRNSNNKDLDTAIFLEGVFTEGNVFVKYNTKKSNYFEKETKRMKENELSKTPKVKAVTPVSV